MKKCNCDWYGTGSGWRDCPVHKDFPTRISSKKKEVKMKQRVKIEPKGERMLRPVSEGTPSTKVTVAPSSNDFFAAVESVSTNKETVKKEKNNMDILTPPETIKKKIDELVQWKKREKEAKAEKESREVDILEFGQKKYEEDGFGNNFQKSFRIKGNTEMITFVSSDKFSAIKAEDIPQLKEILGVKFEEMIQKKQSVSFKAEVLSNPELQKELMSYVPKEKFGAFFQADVYYLTVDGFDRKLFSLGRKVVEKIRELVRQAKPALK